MNHREEPLAGHEAGPRILELLGRDELKAICRAAVSMTRDALTAQASSESVMDVLRFL